jgi:hypothetical protein
MSFFEANRLPIGVRVTSVSASESQLDTIERAQDNSLQGTVFAIKASRGFLTNPLPPPDARAIAGWLHGEGEQWSFNITRKLGTTVSTRMFTPVGDAGLAAFNVTTPGTLSHGSISGVPSRSLHVVSASSAFSDVPFKAQDSGWAVSFFQRSAATPSVVTHSVISSSPSNVISAWHQGTSVSTVRSFQFVKTDGNFRLTLIGRCASVTTNSTTNFALVRFFPFAITPDMVPALGEAVSAQLPFVAARGSFIDRTVDVDFRATVRSQDVSPLVLEDGYEYDSRQLTVGLEER